MADEEVRQKYMELQMAAEQVKQLQMQLQNLEEKSQQLEASVENVEELKNRKSADMLVPIVEGIFVKAKTDSTAEVIINVGAGIAVKKTIGQAREMLQEKQAEMAGYGKQMLAELEKSASVAQRIEEEMGKLLEKNV